MAQHLWVRSALRGMLGVRVEGIGSAVMKVRRVARRVRRMVRACIFATAICVGFGWVVCDGGMLGMDGFVVEKCAVLCCGGGGR